MTRRYDDKEAGVIGDDRGNVLRRNDQHRSCKESRLWFDQFDAGVAIDYAIADSQEMPRRSVPSVVACPVCSRNFSSKGNLNRHNRTAHLGHRVYCDIRGCRQSFSQAADLRRHRARVHQKRHKE